MRGARPPAGSLRGRSGQLLRHGDVPWAVTLRGAAVLLLLLCVGIGWLLWLQSATARAAFGWRFILPAAESSWDPVHGKFLGWPFIYGTIVTSVTALVIAVPISLGVGVFLSELCPNRLRGPLGTMVELLAAVPSVVFGLWGIFVFLPMVVAPTGNLLAASLGHVPFLGALFQGPVPGNGASRLAAALILVIMITPTITLVTRDVFQAIPVAQREAALALGATQWETIWQVVIPYGASGILGAVILGLGRALGETMMVTMVIGNSIEGSSSLLRPGYTMSSIIANEFAEAVTQLHTEALLFIALVMFLMTLLLSLAARILVWNVARRTPQEVRA
jgi:phosphate transport system permease protein